MNLSNTFSQAITRKVGRSNLILQKNSPHILFGVGLAGILTSTVLACRATLQLDKTLDEAKTEIEDLKALKTHDESDDQSYSDKEYYKDLGYVYGKQALKLGKLYGPSIIVGSLSVASLSGSHIQLTKRNSALTVTLAGVAKAYEEYRKLVAAEIGEEKEADIYNGVTEEKITVDGKKELVKVKHPYGGSPYSRCFDESNPCWQPNAELNRTMIHAQQNYFNHRLRAYGHVFLNEVYDGLGFSRTPAGAVVGWLMDGDGDQYIDFGLFEPHNARFMNGLERNVWLDFNVDGVIFEQI